MIAYLRALRAKLHAEAAGLPHDVCYDAAQALREQEALLCRDPEQVDRMLAPLEASARKRALLAAVRDLEQHHAPETVLREAYGRHEEARRAVVAAVEAWLDPPKRAGS